MIARLFMVLRVTPSHLNAMKTRLDGPFQVYERRAAWPQQRRQLGDIGRDPPRLIFGEQVGGRSFHIG
jgi:hypothetical protein